MPHQQLYLFTSFLLLTRKKKSFYHRLSLEFTVEFILILAFLDEIFIQNELLSCQSQGSADGMGIVFLLWLHSSEHVLFRGLHYAAILGENQWQSHTWPSAPKDLGRKSEVFSNCKLCPG